MLLLCKTNVCPICMVRPVCPAAASALNGIRAEAGSSVDSGEWSAGVFPPWFNTFLPWSTEIAFGSCPSAGGPVGTFGWEMQLLVLETTTAEEMGLTARAKWNAFVAADGNCIKRWYLLLLSLTPVFTDQWVMCIFLWHLLRDVAEDRVNIAAFLAPRKPDSQRQECKTASGMRGRFPFLPSLLMGLLNIQASHQAGIWHRYRSEFSPFSSKKTEAEVWLGY